LSPEQAGGDLPTGAADIYALGVILSEMLAPAPAQRLDRAIRRALSRDPAARQPTATELVAAIAGDERRATQQTTALPRGRSSGGAIANARPEAEATHALALAAPPRHEPRNEPDHTGMLPVPEMVENHFEGGRRGPFLPVGQVPAGIASPCW